MSILLGCDPPELYTTSSSSGYRGLEGRDVVGMALLLCVAPPFLGIAPPALLGSGRLGVSPSLEYKKRLILK